jgi:RNA recognition motif-containing protein
MNIFVGNLDRSVTPEDLRKLFAGFGTIVNTIVMKDTRSGRSLGYGHVYMEPDDAAREAIAELNRAPVKGRVIRVRVCRERGRQDRRQNGKTWRGVERRAQNRRLNGRLARGAARPFGQADTASGPD